MEIRFNVGAIELDNCVESRLESLDHIMQGAGFNCLDLTGYCFLQSINCLWVATIDSVFEVSPEKEVTGVQVWAVWRPVHFVPGNFGPPCTTFVTECADLARTTSLKFRPGRVENLMLKLPPGAQPQFRLMRSTIERYKAER